VTFDTKIAIVVKEDLPVWQKLNVTAFTVSGIVSTPEVLGAVYEDASGHRYLPMIRQPIMMFSASHEQIRNVYRMARENALPFSIFTEELFSTPNDDENRAAVRAVPSDELKLVGMAIRGPKKTMDKILKGCPLHR
jgi:hypothetical protein